MTIYRYKAIAMDGSHASTAGERAADSPVALRASLRRIGLQVIEAKPVGHSYRVPALLAGVFEPLQQGYWRHLRSRRVRLRADLYDSLATLLESGLPLVEAVSTIAASRADRALGSMLLALREALREGVSLDVCMSHHPGWFDNAQIAMVCAARASGELPAVLRALSERHQRAGALSAKLISTLTYPAAVLCVGIGVVIFLSSKTLPDLVGILQDANIEPPGLTMAIMATGQMLLRFGLVLLVGSMLLGLLTAVLIGKIDPTRRRVPKRVRLLVPRALRQARFARAWSTLAQLVVTGVPLVEALRITAPTVRSPGSTSLARALLDAADQIEQGSNFADALTDSIWFDAECKHLIAIGENAGQLSEILARLALRTHRAAVRSIDRFAALLEPAVILLLATGIGFVVIGAVLPILKLQEVIG